MLKTLSGYPPDSFKCPCRIQQALYFACMSCVNYTLVRLLRVIYRNKKSTVAKQFTLKNIRKVKLNKKTGLHLPRSITKKEK